MPTEDLDMLEDSPNCFMRHGFISPWAGRGGMRAVWTGLAHLPALSHMFTLSHALLPITAGTLVPPAPP